MKRFFLSFAIVIFTLMTGFFIGNYFLKNKNNQNIIAEKKENTIVLEKINNIKNEEIETSSQEDKISVDTEIVKITYYKECDHKIEDKIKNKNKYINMTKEKFQKEFPNWEIKEFNLEKVVLYKEEDDFCNEHFLVKDEDGYVTIYTINNNDEILELLDKTEIATNYLTRCRSRKFKKWYDNLLKRKFK